MPHTTYADLLGFSSDQLEELANYGRATLRVNDVLMCAAEGDGSSVFKSCIREVVEVALINLCYAMLRKDWNMAGISLAALELSLNRPDFSLAEKLMLKMRGSCGELNCALRKLAPEELRSLLEEVVTSQELPPDPAAD